MGQCLALLNTTAFGTDRADYLKINPNGRIPALVDDDLEMFEAAAIIFHLVDQHPEAGLVPKVGTPERAKFYQ
jgi:glutathione S-transferase